LEKQYKKRGKIMKGIILAGGTGSRLYPITLGVSKQMLPVYNKPMIYYPLSILMLCGIRDILVISTPNDLEYYKRLLRDGSQFGISFSYISQEKPKGLPEAYLLAEEFLKNETSCMILGDNILYGNNLENILNLAVKENAGASIFAYKVKDPERYGIVELDNSGNPISITEKPKNPKSNLAIPGIYIFDKKAIEYAKAIKPSKRGELEITDIIRKYLDSGSLSVYKIGRGVAWLDAGTHKSLMQASEFIHTIEDRQGLLISSPEEIAFYKKYITKEQLIDLANKYKNEYGEYLLETAKGCK
jgi:glucose-1-phosphate thymidylyltransferase